MSADAEAASFTTFVEDQGRRLQRAPVATLGPDLGDDACSEALTYAWQNWQRVGAMDNPAGYLYRLGQNKGRRMARRKPQFPPPPQPTSDGMPDIEPGLPAALESLSEKQRVATVLVHCEDWTLTEVADLFDIDVGSVNKHVERGLAKLRKELEVSIDV